MGLGIEHVREGLRFAVRALSGRKVRYIGTPVEICHKIVDDCWNKRYFTVSAGHFHEFYMRDLGWCAESLISLGYKQKLLESMEYVLSVYSRHGKLTTTITPRDIPIDVFSLAPDTLAYCFRILRLLDAENVVKRHKAFLQSEIDRYHRLCIDKKTCLVREDRSFSSMKDNLRRVSSTYDNCMLSMASDDIDHFGLNNPFGDMKKKIVDRLWCNDGFFYDDMEKKRYIAGDANIFPFICGVTKDRKMLKSCLVKIHEAGLDDPFPLKYTNFRIKDKELWPMNWFASNYEGTAIWMHMGPLYVKLLMGVDKRLYLKHKATYRRLIEEHGNFLEVYEEDGSPYKKTFYRSDESMLWAANYLTL